MAIRDARSAVISTELAEELGEFLRSRHDFRNVYGFVLEADRLAVLQGRLSAVLPRFVREIRAFLDWLVGE